MMDGSMEIFHCLRFDTGSKNRIVFLPFFHSISLMKTIAIIGAWAAGLMAAATILESASVGSIRILLIEKNTFPGKKVIISGWGRCNLTTGITDKKLLLSKYIRWSDFLKSALGKFSPKKCREWFESHGIPLKCEEDNRVFPSSDDGHDVVDVFENIFSQYRSSIDCRYGVSIESIQKMGDSYTIFTSKDEKICADICVLATGWNAYKHTGSTGDGYDFARSLWHTITPLGPSLSSFLTKESWLHTLSGLAFQSPLLHWGKIQSPAPVLLTHFWISGPGAFMLSAYMAFETLSSKQPISVLFQPDSTLATSDWNLYLQWAFLSHPKKLLTTILSEKLPKRFSEAFVTEFFPQIATTFAGSIARKDRESIALLLGGWVPITLLERRPGDEFVTAGWVSTQEIYQETMESRISSGLYLIWELIDVDAVTWGFNLQGCWSMGFMAGNAIVKTLDSPLV